MALRIGIDVGGTFTHGVVLRPPGDVLARARVPTTHTDARGVAAGVEAVLHLLLAELPALGCGPADVELVAHSTTQATNALLEGDLAAVRRIALIPPGEGWLARRTLRGDRLSIGGGHYVPLETQLVGLEQLNDECGMMNDELKNGIANSALYTSIHHSSLITHHSDCTPVAVIQPLAGRQPNREREVAAHYDALGHPTVCAGDITQVLGLAARARTATVNAAMLPTMLATADYTQAAVEAVLPGVPLQVVRSDGGAMSIAEMRRQPILSLLSGPAAGASAALHRSGLANAVFIEVGGTSTDITLIKDGRVRHRSATVGGQRLMVPALDLRTVAVGGGSMLRADTPLFGPRSAHIAGLPYLFQALEKGLTVKTVRSWAEGVDPLSLHDDDPQTTAKLLAIHTMITECPQQYSVAVLNDGSIAAYTLTDYAAPNELGLAAPVREALLEARALLPQASRAAEATCAVVSAAVRELARSAEADLMHCRLLGGGGGAPTINATVADQLGLPEALIDDHAVISAIGAALAVTCVSLSTNVAQPGAGDIAELTAQVEARLAAQGAERVSTDYEYDPRRQVLTVTGRGSRPYEADARAHSTDELQALAAQMLGSEAHELWGADSLRLWSGGSARGKERRAAFAARDGRAPLYALATDSFGRILWQGRLSAHVPVEPGGIGAALDGIVARYTAHTDGGAVLPGLALLAAGRFIPLDSLGSAELVAEVLRWENLPADAAGCFVIRV